MGKKGIKREYVCIEGSPFNRGMIHGENLHAEIRELIGLWKKNIQRNTGMAAEDFITKFLNHTSYKTAVEQYTPDLLEEVKGIAEGSGIDFDTIFAFQLLDELILNAGDVVAHCSSVGVNKTENKPTLIGQNWDIESYIHGFQTVLHVKEEISDLESFVFTYAGLIAAFGVNNKGVGICLNSLPILHYEKKGLPVAYVIRGVLENLTMEGAIRFIDEIEHASPQNYIIGDSEKIVDVECSSGKVVHFSIKDSPGIVYHTNHPLVNDDYDFKYLTLLKEREEGVKSNKSYHKAVEYLEKDSGTRFSNLQNRLGNFSAGEITVDRIKSTLSSHDSPEYPICMDLGEETKLATIVSTVMELSDAPVFHVAFGPPDVTPFKAYKFSDK